MKPPRRLFHGSVELFERPQTGGYDNVFWTATTSTIAQSYIPASGTSILINLDRLGDDLVAPSENDPWWSVARQMGFTAVDVTKDYMGRATSWRARPHNPRRGEVREYIENTLGYRADPLRGHCCWLKSGHWDPVEKINRIMPADWKMPGYLYIIEPAATLRWFDMTDQGGDLLDPQYNQLSRFERIRRAGYDGVVINDYAQTEHWGNLGHRSFGIFDHALPQLTLTRIPAQRYDFGTQVADLNVLETPEYSAWLAANAARSAIAGIPPRTRAAEAVMP